MGDCFSAVVGFLTSCLHNSHFSQIMQQIATFWLGLTAGLVEKVTSILHILFNQKVKSFLLRLIAGLVEKVTSIRCFLTSKLQQPQSLLPSLINNTDDSKSHELIIQNLQKLELGKFAFTLATTATVGLLFSQKLQDDDQPSSPHHLIIVGFMVSCVLLYNGVVFGAINPRLGNIMQLIGITLVLCLLSVLAGTFLPAGLSVACWVCAAFCLVPFLYVLIKPHPRPYLQRFQA